MKSIRQTLLPPLRLSTMSSTAPTTLGITQVLEAPTSNTPAAPSPPLYPGHPLLLPALSLWSLDSPSLPPPSYQSIPPLLLILVLPLSTQTPSSPTLLAPAPILSDPCPHLLWSPPLKPFALQLSSALNSLVQKPPPISSALPKKNLTPSFLHSIKTIGCNSSSPVTLSTMSPSRTSQLRIFLCPLSKLLLPQLLPLLCCHLTAASSPSLSMLLPLNTSLPPHLPCHYWLPPLPTLCHLQIRPPCLVFAGRVH